MLYYLKNYVDQNKAGSNSGDNNANEDELLKKSKDKMRRPIIEEFSEFSLRLVIIFCLCLWLFIRGVLTKVTY